MEGRTSLLATLALVLSLGGCVHSRQGDLPSQPPPAPTFDSAPTEPVPTSKQAELKKSRRPSAELVTSLAVIREEASVKRKEAAPDEFIRMLDDARQLYLEALKLDSDYRKAQDGLVRVYTYMGEHHKAQEILQKMLQKQPQNGGIWIDLGMSYNRQKNTDEALRCFRKALETDPDNRQYMQPLGFTLVWAGRVNEGAEYLTKVMGNATAHYNVAGILRQQDRLDEARQHLQLALEADPAHQRARDMLASLRSGPVLPDQIVPAEALTGTDPRLAFIPPQ